MASGHPSNGLARERDRRLEIRLGQRLRQLRLESGVSAAELARRSGVSPSFVSRVERGLVSPSVGVLARWAAHLSLSVGSFFIDPPDDADAAVEPAPARGPNERWRVVRKDERKILRLSKETIAFELLTPDLQRSLAFLWVEHEPHEPMPSWRSAHTGEEAILVIQGELNLLVGDDEVLLKAGDCVTLDSSILHYGVNLSDEKAIVLIAMVPPSF
jgi:transcriptional regulator with XRE-family HTH domain